MNRFDEHEMMTESALEMFRVGNHEEAYTFLNLIFKNFPGNLPPASAPGNASEMKFESHSLNDAVQRLATLSPLEYDRIRKDEAKELGVRPSTLDAVVKGARKGTVNDDMPFDVVEPWPEPVNPAQLLSDISSTIKRFIICDNDTAHAVALWAAMTWFIDVIQVAPLAVITAPEKRCGKSQLLFLLGRLSARAMTASSISPSALFRTIDAWCPTLLIDECDALLKDNEELRGLLNSGHTRDSAYVIRCVGESFTPTKFNTWGAKALAGIGHVADTLMDRAIILELRRKLPDEKTERLRYAEESLFDNLRSKLARFAEDYQEQMKLSRPPLPMSLNDRAQDNWEPLLAIAMIAGKDWLKIATNTALKLSGGEIASQTIGTELLSDIQEIFESKGIDRISSIDLIKALCCDEEKPWATYNRGNQIRPRQIASKLKGYGIQSKTVRIGFGEVAKGYELGQFKETFTRYLTPPEKVTELQPPPIADSQTFSTGNAKVTENAQELQVTGQADSPSCNPVTNKKTCNLLGNEKVTHKPAPIADCNRVTDITPQTATPNFNF